MAANTRDPVVEDCMDVFRLSFTQAIPFLQEAEQDAAAYAGKIDRDHWPTLSEIVIPLAKTATEQALATLYPYLLPTTVNFFDLSPVNESMDYGTIQNLTDYLHYVLRRRMQIYPRGMLTLKDIIMLGTGYGCVENRVVTPPKRAEVSGYLAGQRTAVIQMQPGEPEVTETYTYVPFGAVIPSPDGDMPDTASAVFHLDFYTEAAFKALYDEASGMDMMGSAEAVIAMARQRKLNGYLSPAADIMASISGLPYMPSQVMPGTNVKKAPVLVPVLKCYFQHRHVWIACGIQRIYDVQNQFSTLRCPIVKGTANPTGGKWYNRGIVGGSLGLHHGANMFYNALMDLIDLYLHPPKVVDTSIIPEDQIENFGPYATFHGQGPVDKALKYWFPEALNPQLFNLGPELRNLFSDAVGQPSIVRGEGPAGLMRGGSGAFESLLQSSTAREKLMGAICETTWLQQTIENALLLCQANIGAEGVDFPVPVETERAREFKQVTITAEDLRHVLAVDLNLEEKVRNQAASVNIATQYYGVARQSPYVNPKELDAWMAEQVGGIPLRRRLLAGVNPKDRIAELQSLAPGNAEMTQGEQAVAGGSAQVTGGTMGG